MPLPEVKGLAVGKGHVNFFRTRGAVLSQGGLPLFRIRRQGIRYALSISL